MKNNVSGSWQPAALCSAQMFATLHNLYAKVYLTKDGVGKSEVRIEVEGEGVKVKGGKLKGQSLSEFHI